MINSNPQVLALDTSFKAIHVVVPCIQLVFKQWKKGIRFTGIANKFFSLLLPVYIVFVRSLLILHYYYFWRSIKHDAWNICIIMWSSTDWISWCSMETILCVRKTKMVKAWWWFIPLLFRRNKSWLICTKKFMSWLRIICNAW